MARTIRESLSSCSDAALGTHDDAIAALDAFTAPSDDPRPALGELARTLDLESLGHIARRMIAAKKAVPFDAFQYSEAERVYLNAFGEAGDGPERVLQLVALATGGAEGGLQQNEQQGG
jgi:hypothetical protein